MDFKPMNAKAHTVEEAIAKCQSPIMEIKYDGWRMVVTVEEDGAHFWSRTGKEYTGKVPHIEAEIAKLFPVGTILDGEIVDLEDHECTAVTNVFGKSKSIPEPDQIAKLTYVAFDIIQDGEDDVTHWTLTQRKYKITATLERADHRLVTTSKWFEATEERYTQFIADGLEGAMVKCAEAPYKKGKRGHGWFKVKGNVTIDVVVMELPHNGKGKFEGQVGNVVVGQIEDGIVVPVAQVNAPDDATRLHMTSNPEEYVGRVMEMKHYGKLKDGYRHPTFIRWREDKKAEDCLLGVE